MTQTGIVKEVQMCSITEISCVPVASIVVVADIFGLTDSVFAAIDYLITPLFVTARMLDLYVILLLIEFFQKRWDKQLKQQEGK